MSYNISDYNNKCGSCEHLKSMECDDILFEGGSCEKGHCIMLKSNYYPDSKACSYYKDRQDSEACSYYTDRQDSEACSYYTGCYITTIVCNLLGYDDDCGILETLRGFRENIMHKDEKYKEMLHEYDIVGPQIAANLQKDFVNNQDKELVNSIFNFYIQPTAKLVDDKKYDLAVERYKEMTKTLKEYYGISYDGKVPNNYDYQQGGHGKVILKSLDNK